MKQARIDSSWLTRTVDNLLRHRLRVLLAAGVMTVLLGFAILGLSFTTSPETVLRSSYPELQGLRSHERELGTFEHRLILVIQTGDAFAPAMLERLARASALLVRAPGVRRLRSLAAPGLPLPDAGADPEEFRRAVLDNSLLTPFLVARDARTTAIWVDLAPAADRSGNREQTIDGVLAAAREAGLEPLITGVPAVRMAYATHIRDDLLLLPPLVTAILLVLLFVAFRRLVLVLAPLLVVGIASLWTLGVLALTGGEVSALTSILPSLVLVVGTATGIHVVARFREASYRGLPPRMAARESMIHMALPCGLTAVTTAVGFSSLLIARIDDVQQFGTYSAVGALLAFLLGLPLTGILLSYTRPGPSGRAPGAPRGARLLRGLSRLLVRAPVVGILAGVLAALGSLAGITRLRNETFMLEDVREEAPIHRATSEVDRHLGGVIGFDLVIRCQAGVLSPEVIRFARSLEREYAALPGVRAVAGPAALLDQAASAAGMAGSADDSGPMLLAGIRAFGGGDVAGALVSGDARLARIVVNTGDVGSTRSLEIRDEVLARAAARCPEGVAISVGGLKILAEELLGRLVIEMARSTAVAFLIIFLLMSVLFRSLAVGALSMIPNFLPLISAVGFMGLAGITVRSSTALIFAVALGIAVDDTIHLITRYRRERRLGKNARRAVMNSIRWTGRPVLLTSTVLACGFLSFGLSEFKATFEFGLIAAVTIAAALVGDLLLLPALLLLKKGADRA